MVELSIIIVNWNTKELLKNCLNSIIENPPKCSYEIIVVDNASSDGSQEMIKNLFQNVILIESGSNIGYSKANNLGFKKSKGKYILFLNSDTLVHYNTLKEALEFMETHEEAGILGCKNLNPDGSVQYSAFNFPSPIRIFAYITGLNKIFKISRFRDFSKIRTIDYVSGAFLLIKREIFEKISKFDEKFFMYNEDVDLCKRVWNIGLKVYYNPHITITHYLGGSSKNNHYILKHYIDSSLYLYKKHQKQYQFIILKIFILGALFIKIFFETLSAAFKGNQEKIQRIKFLVSLISKTING